LWAGDAWISQPAQSRLQFVVSYEGQEVVGEFHDFQVKLAFNPSDLTAASLEVLVDITSVDMDSDDLNFEIIKPDWFSAGQFPQARFISDSIRVDGRNGFVASGSLRLKGVDKPIEVPFTWSSDDGQVLLRGEVELQRTDFAIGTGEWADGGTIDTTVKARYQVSLDRPAEKAKAVIDQLRQQHGDLIFHQSGGCCDGSAPMCFAKGEFLLGSRDLC
jgi:polyisoprenoid-binding protein YceI